MAMIISFYSVMPQQTRLVMRGLQMLWEILSAGKNWCTGKDANEAHSDEPETLVKKKRDEKKDLVDEEKEKKAENSTFTFSWTLK